MPNDKGFSRRKMLSRLGLTAGAVYLAPSLTTLSKARASSGSSGGSGGSSGGSSGASDGSTASGPSASNGPSFASADSSSPSNVGGFIGLIQERMQRP